MNGKRVLRHTSKIFLLTSVLLTISFMFTALVRYSKGDYHTDSSTSFDSSHTMDYGVTGNLYYDPELTNVVSDITTDSLGQTYYIGVRNEGEVAASYSVSFQGTTLSDLLRFMKFTQTDYSLDSQYVSHNNSSSMYTQVSGNRKLMSSNLLQPGGVDIYQVTIDWNEFYESFVTNETYKDYFQTQTLVIRFTLEHTQAE